nr:MAG TPA: hypothetical protein [Bacteriophage sp.]
MMLIVVKPHQRHLMSMRNYSLSSHKIVTLMQFSYELL